MKTKTQLVYIFDIQIYHKGSLLMWCMLDMSIFPVIGVTYLNSIFILNYFNRMELFFIIWSVSE